MSNVRSTSTWKRRAERRSPAVAPWLAWNSMFRILTTPSLIAFGGREQRQRPPVGEPIEVEVIATDDQRHAERQHGDAGGGDEDGHEHHARRLGVRDLRGDEAHAAD